LRSFLEKVDGSKLDRDTKLEVDAKIRHILEETAGHSVTLANIIKEITWSEREQY
jgi:hypothetical protein